MREKTLQLSKDGVALLCCHVADLMTGEDAAVKLFQQTGHIEAIEVPICLSFHALKAPSTLRSHRSG